MRGIYKIVNTINGKVYIGQSIRIKSRKIDHLRDLRQNKHINKHLQAAFNKYGEQNFKFEIIECYEDDFPIEELTKREQYWIDYYGGLDSSNNYNKREAGSKGPLSEESKRKLSAKHKGKKVIITEETKQKISKSLKGRPAHNKGSHHTLDTRKRISEKLKGVPKPPRTKEHARKLSESLKGKPAWNKGRTDMPYKGIKRSEETKARIRNTQAKLYGYEVYQYDLEGNFIAKYPSTMEAERQTGFVNSGIGACCRGLQKTSHGFIWSKVPLNIQ